MQCVGPSCREPCRLKKNFNRYKWVWYTVFTWNYKRNWNEGVYMDYIVNRASGLGHIHNGLMMGFILLIHYKTSHMGHVFRIEYFHEKP